VDANGLAWTLGELRGRQTVTLKATLRTSQTGPVTNKVQVETIEGLRGERSATTDVTPEPRAVLKVAAEGPETAAVGAALTYRIVVSNPGTAPAENVVLTAKFDAGLEHETKDNAVEMRVGTLGPGESKSLPALTLTARQAGVFTTALTARADGGLSDGGKYTVTVKRAEVKVGNKGPAWRYVGRPAEWSVEVENAGELPLTNVVVRDALPPELTFQSASDGGTLQGDQVTWPIGTLKPGEHKALKLTTVCQAPAARVLTTVSVTADAGVTAKAEAPLEVRGLPAVRIKVTDRDDPVTVGQATEYRVEVTNQGSLAAEVVQVVAVVPDEMRLVQARGPATATIEGQRVTFPALASLAPGQSVAYTVEVQALKAGPVYFRAELTTSTLTKALVEEESTSVLPANGGAKGVEVPAPPR
jgi:uncharacterized repeat protein (TIGR01451 family)